LTSLIWLPPGHGEAELGRYTPEGDENWYDPWSGSKEEKGVASRLISIGGTRETFPSEPTRHPCDHDQRRQGCAAPEELDLDDGARRGCMVAGRRMVAVPTDLSPSRSNGPVSFSKVPLLSQMPYSRQTPRVTSVHCQNQSLMVAIGALSP